MKYNQVKINNIDCGKDIIIKFINNDDKDFYELLAVKKFFKHKNTCVRCKHIQQRKIEYEKRNSLTKVSSKAICGEEIFMQRKGIGDDKSLLMSMERSVVDMYMSHIKTCPKCITIIKRWELTIDRKNKMKKLNGNL